MGGNRIGFRITEPKRQACLNCPLTRKRKKCDGNGNCEKVNRACKTMYEGKASHYAVEWPRLELLFLASVLLVSCMLSAFGTLYHRMYREVYDEAFAEWRRRGIVTHIEFVPATGGRLTGMVGILRISACFSQSPWQMAPQGQTLSQRQVRRQCLLPEWRLLCRWRRWPHQRLPSKCRPTARPVK